MRVACGDAGEIKKMTHGANGLPLLCTRVPLRWSGAESFQKSTAQADTCTVAHAHASNNNTNEGVCGGVVSAARAETWPGLLNQPNTVPVREDGGVVSGGGRRR